MLALGIVSFANAQNCTSFALSKGMVLNYENFDSRGNLTVKSVNTCLDVRTNNTGVTIYEMTTLVSDANDAPISYMEYEMECEDGSFNVGIGGFSDPELIKENDMQEIFVDTTGILYPVKLYAGQTLPDATISISKANLDGTTVTYKTKISNRKVIDVESVTVPAGTFECFKITFDIQVKGLFKKKYNVVEYFSEGIGKIKNENFTMKGKLNSSSQLVELKK